MEVSQVSVAIGVVRAARATRNRFVLAFRFIGSVNSFASPLCAAPMPFSLVGTASLPPREAENVVFGTQVAGEMASFRPFFRQFLPHGLPYSSKLHRKLTASRLRVWGAIRALVCSAIR